MGLFVSTVIFGVALGAIYGLFAVGYSMVYSILRLMNLAHGDVLMLGTFVGFGALESGLSVPLAIALAVGTGGILAIIVDQIAYRPLRSTGDQLGPLIAALGVALIIRNVATAQFGVQTRSFPPVLGSGVVNIGGVLTSLAPIASVVIAIAFIAIFNVFLQRNRWGWAIQAAAQDLPAARLMGIPVTPTVALIYLLAGVLGVLGGTLYASVYGVIFIGIGWTATLKAFTAAILGGIGSLYGAIIGGLLLGLIESLATVYVSSEYKDAISYALMILIFLIRPQGLFGAKVISRV